MEASYSYLSSCKPTICILGVQCRRRGHDSAVVRASNKRDHHEGKLVDESMIVLRLRIKEMKNHEPPSNWMDWEKKCYDHYDEDVCNAIGLLQSYLMGTRPSVAFRILALVAFSVPFSSAMFLFCALEIGKTIFSSVGLC